MSKCPCCDLYKARIQDMKITIAHQEDDIRMLREDIDFWSEQSEYWRSRRGGIPAKKRKRPQKRQRSNHLRLVSSS